MPNTTDNLGLFKYDLDTDGQLAFSITQSLNNNWDILDQAYEELNKDNYLIDSYIEGDIFYRKYSDGWMEQGGTVYASETEVKWVQPTLVSNGTLGGPKFAVAADSYYQGHQPYMAFSSGKNPFWQSTVGGSIHWLTMYNPVPLKPSLLAWVNGGSGTTYDVIGGYIQGSNDNSSWEDLAEIDDMRGANVQRAILIDTNNYYKYIRVYITRWVSTTALMKSIKLTATCGSGTSTNIVFPVSFSNINYNYNLSYYNVSSGDTYITSKFSTGMTLSNTSLGTIYWTARGY